MDIFQKVAALEGDKEKPANYYGELLRTYIFGENGAGTGYVYTPDPTLDYRELTEKEVIEALIASKDWLTPGHGYTNKEVDLENKHLLEITHGLITKKDDLTIIAAWYADGDMQLFFAVYDVNGEKMLLRNSDAKKDYNWKFC